MKVVVYRGPGKVAVEEQPDPSVESDTDAVVRITTSAVCGSDLHIYHGRLPNVPEGSVMGHEFIGVVESIGDKVEKFVPGQRVVGAFGTSCGKCWYCTHQLPSQCVNGALFGFGNPGVGGCQGELLRVPFADGTLEPVPDGLPDTEAIFIGDIFSTGFFAVENGGVKPGDVVAVVGCGPVGLFAQMSAQLFGAAAIFGLDLVEERLKLAQEIGSIPVNVNEQDAVALIRAATEGRGADVVCECVGHESALRLAMRLFRPGGTVSVVGVYAENNVEFPMGRAFMRDLTFKIGICNVKNYMARLTPLVVNKKVDLSRIVTHAMKLEEAPYAYEIFDQKRDNAVKILLAP
ncbi:MAG: alcohol dehydrogenase catalytic domain-containing protein [Chloroflexi bacterium]|nr:alcohol dehydrogenase catalytic domain-containing protein [Chloroflexota bacterium]